MFFLFSLLTGVFGVFQKFRDQNKLLKGGVRGWGGERGGGGWGRGRWRGLNFPQEIPARERKRERAKLIYIAGLSI